MREMIHIMRAVGVIEVITTKNNSGYCKIINNDNQSSNGIAKNNCTLFEKLIK